MAEIDFIGNHTYAVQILYQNPYMKDKYYIKTYILSTNIISIHSLTQLS